MGGWPARPSVRIQLIGPDGPVDAKMNATTTAADLVHAYASRGRGGRDARDARDAHIVFADCVLPATTVLMSAGVMEDAVIHLVVPAAATTRCRSRGPQPTRSPSAPAPAPESSPPRIRCGRRFPGF